MTDVKTIPVLEPCSPLRFSSRGSLIAHVRKHILFGRDERWSQLCDAETIAEARRETKAGQFPGPCTKRLLGEYLRMGRDAMLALCRQQQGHWHFYSEPVLFSDDGQWIRPESPPEKAVQTVLAWDVEKKLLIIAKSFVRNGEFTAYKLCSVYRPYPRLSGNSLRKNIKRSLWAQTLLKRSQATRAMIADHDIG